MDIKDAWNLFAKSGKVQDYLKYREIANEAEHTGTDNKGTADGRG